MLQINYKTVNAVVTNSSVLNTIRYDRRV